MPELPDVELYLHALEPRVVGEEVIGIRVASFSILKTYDPPIDRVVGRTVEGLRRVGKRVVFGLADDWFLVVHLMISGRFQWRPPGAGIPRRVGHLAIDFPDGTLLLTEASTKKRASVSLVVGEDALAEHDRGGIDPLSATLDRFTAKLTEENRTLKRALTDPRMFSGIGNAYSDEILHRAKLSPVQRSRNLDEAALARLHENTIDVLVEWRDRLIAENGDAWPSKVTAFRPEMAVHGKYREACPACGDAVQRIAYASNEVNYCPTCQTGGKALADRSLSRLLGDDWEGMGLAEE